VSCTLNLSFLVISCEMFGLMGLPEFLNMRSNEKIQNIISKEIFLYINTRRSMLFVCGHFDKIYKIIFYFDNNIFLMIKFSKNLINMLVRIN
jgi:hypothetical protein